MPVVTTALCERTSLFETDSAAEARSAAALTLRNGEEASLSPCFDLPAAPAGTTVHVKVTMG